MIYAEDLLNRLPGATIIADVKASRALFDRVAELGGKPLMWKTGHSLIKSKMKETHAPLAGEMSGHVFFAENYYGFDDALYAAVRLIGTDAQVDATDGVRVTTPDGWWLLRASNTQDVLVARAESYTDEGLARLLRQIDEQLEASGLERGPQAGH